MDSFDFFDEDEDEDEDDILDDFVFLDEEMIFYDFFFDEEMWIYGDYLDFLFIDFCFIFVYNRFSLILGFRIFVFIDFLTETDFKIMV